jgi:hypothetical protein
MTTEELIYFMIGLGIILFVAWLGPIAMERRSKK